MSSPRALKIIGPALKIGRLQQVLFYFILVYVLKLIYYVIQTSLSFCSGSIDLLSLFYIASRFDFFFLKQAF